VQPDAPPPTHEHKYADIDPKYAGIDPTIAGVPPKFVVNGSTNAEGKVQGVGGAAVGGLGVGDRDGGAEIDAKRWLQQAAREIEALLIQVFVCMCVCARVCVCTFSVGLSCSLISLFALKFASQEFYL
jgi:hypothetical protein